MIHSAVKALVDRKVNYVRTSTATRPKSTLLQIEIDDRCLKMIALQPAGRLDLRFITAAIKINSDLERIADQRSTSVRLPSICFKNPSSSL